MRRLTKGDYLHDGEALVLRADAGPMGTGHLMRCLALAQSWRGAGGRSLFALATAPAALEARLESEGFAYERVAAVPGSSSDAARTAEIAHRWGAGWVVVDGYQFNTAYQEALKDQALRLLTIDDTGHAGRYAADVILNQNLYADAGLYADRAAHARLLLGPRFALLRAEFRSWRRRRAATPDVGHRILVTLGGADRDNVTLAVIHAIKRLSRPDLAVRVLAGAANPHHDLLVEEARLCPGQMEVLAAAERGMPALMAWADLAVSAAGSTCWELAYMGLPAILVTLADNQRLIAESSARARIALSAGWYSELSPQTLAGLVEHVLEAPELRSEMSMRGRATVDGLGAERVAASFDLAPV